eukprot:Clim_evm21s142 gene=Clim_evmTU21s142
MGVHGAAALEPLPAMNMPKDSLGTRPPPQRTVSEPGTSSGEDVLSTKGKREGKDGASQKVVDAFASLLNEVQHDATDHYPEFLACIREGDENRVREMLSTHEADVNDPEWNRVVLSENFGHALGDSVPVGLAAYHGHSVILDMLLAAGADIHRRLNTGIRSRKRPTELKGIRKCAIHLAVQGGHEDSLMVLLEHGADIDEMSEEGTPIVLAALCKKITIVEYLFACGADPDAYDESGNTVLHILAENGGPVDLMRIAIDAGAEVERTNRYGLTPAAWAIEKLSLSANYNAYTTSELDQVLLLLLEAGTNPIRLQCRRRNTRNSADRSYTATLLHYLVDSKCDPETTLLALQFCPRVDVLDSNGKTPLFLATERCTSLLVLQHLVDTVSDPATRKLEEHSSTKTQRGLVKPMGNLGAQSSSAGASDGKNGNPNTNNGKDSMGRPIDSAMGDKGENQKAPLLRQKSHPEQSSSGLASVADGVDKISLNSEPFGETGGKLTERRTNQHVTRPSPLRSTSTTAETPFYLAVEYVRALQTVHFLLEHGADPNVPDPQQKTCLHLCVNRYCQSKSVSNDFLAVVTALLKAGADIDAEDIRGHTVLQIAESHQNTQILNIIHKHRDVN